jgi:hypothetical protein
VRRAEEAGVEREEALEERERLLRVPLGREDLDLRLQDR